MIFLFLLIQITLSRNNIDKNKLKIRTTINNSFFQKNSVYLFSFSTFFITREFFKRVDYQESIMLFNMFHMLAVLSIILFIYEWYSMVKKCSYEKTLPLELTNFKKQ